MKKGMEIGSIYEVDPAVAGKRMEAEELHLAYVEKYGKQHRCFTASGREAIALALISLEREKQNTPKRCMMPAYMCDSVFQPFCNRGWELIFYAVDSELASVGETLFRQVLENDPGLIFVHPYYGRDTCREFRSQLAAFRKSGILVMEDVTQSYYLEKDGREADFIVGSLRKWYPVPDGGFVVSDIPLAEDVLQEGEAYAAKRLAPLTQKWIYLHDISAGQAESAKVQTEGVAKQIAAADRQQKKAAFLQENRAQEAALDQYEGVRRMSELSAAILSEMDEEAARQQRSENQFALYENIVGMKRVRPILPMKGEEAPLYLPVYAKERDDLQRFLAENDIYAPVLWELGEENRDFLEGDEAYIYEHMLALPIDQRYGAAEMERIAQTLSDYERQPAIGIRADANDTIATGHIMRCITIAGQLRKRGCRVLFFTADDGAKNLLSQAGMEHICLRTQWDQMEDEIPRLRQMLSLSGVKLLLVDSYQATPAYFEGLRDVVRLVWIDDCFDAVCPVDLLINYNAYHTRFPYEETYGGRTKLLLGPAYVPLREEFAADAARFSDEADRQREAGGMEQSGAEGGMENASARAFHVLLSSGGGDAQNALLEFLENVPETVLQQNVVYHVTVGERYLRTRELTAFAKKHSNVKLYQPCRDMAGLMHKCDAAVSAAGTMLFELSAMQVPAVFFVAADNQRYDSEFFAAEERMLFAGDIRQDREGCVQAVSDGLKRLLADDELRERMRERLAGVTDGQGAARIAEEITRLTAAAEQIRQ